MQSAEVWWQSGQEPIWSQEMATSGYLFTIQLEMFISYCSYPYDQIPYRNSLREEGFTLAHSFRFITAGQGQRVRLEAVRDDVPQMPSPSDLYPRA